MDERPTNTKTLRHLTALSVLVLALVGLPIVIFAASQAVQTDTRAAVENPTAGDVNADGAVNLDDVGFIRKDIESGEYSKASDVNTDGEVDTNDISKFYEILSLKQ